MPVFFSKRKKTTPLTELNYLDFVPVQRLEADLETGSGRVAVLMPRYGDPLLGRLLQPRLGPEKRFIRVPLDSRGSFLWPLIDGDRSVADLAAAYEAAFPDDSDDVHLRVSLYLQAMYDNKFITYLNNEL